MPAQVSILGELFAWSGVMLAFGALLVLAFVVRKQIDANRKERDAHARQIDSLTKKLVAMTTPYPAEALLKMQQSQIDLAGEQWRAAAQAHQSQADQHPFPPAGGDPPEWSTQAAS